MIGLLLEKVRDHLRSQLALTAVQCDIAPDGHPPAEAAKEFIGVDEGGSTNGSQEMLSEVFDVVVTVCRQPGAWPARKRGDMLLRADPYLNSIRTMTARARDVIRLVNANYAIIDAANAAIGVPGATTGDWFVGALFYVSQSRNRVIESEDGHLWVCRDVVFRGAWRPQSLSIQG